MATAIRSGIRSTDELVRYGCDKFVVVMPNIPSDDFTRRLHQVSDAVHSTIIPGHEYVSLTACVGGVRIHGETVDEGVGRAAQLLSRAKAKAGTVVTDADSIEAFQSEKPSVLIVDDSEMNRAILNEMLDPIRERRRYYEERIEWVYDVLHKGSETAREEAARTLHDVREAMKINYFEDSDLIASQAALYREKLG